VISKCSIIQLVLLTSLHFVFCEEATELFYTQITLLTVLKGLKVCFVVMNTDFFWLRIDITITGFCTGLVFIAYPGLHAEFFCFLYILFINIIGGILVLFIYITRLASNEIFSPSNKIHREVGRAKDLTATRFILFDG
jgi:hypothetical protein